VSSIVATPERDLDAVEKRRAFGAIGYVPRWTIQTNLPHSDPGLVDSWTRINGNLRLTVQPFIEEFEAAHVEHTQRRNRGPRAFTKRRSTDDRLVQVIHHGIPYGPLPRLFLAYVGYQVVTRKSAIIELGEDLTSFMRELALVAKWGRNGTNERLRDQVHRFATCKIAVVRPGKPYHSFSFADELDEFWQIGDGEMRGEWKSTMTLTHKAYSDFLTSYVPTNLATLFVLKKSALALDIYNWLSLRLFKMEEPSALISYQLLSMQFGSDYTDLRQFKRRFLEALQKVRAEYRDAKIDIDTDGITLYPSPPHVRSRIASL
jgi:hypothetical protein